MDKELKRIKKLYGEAMMHYCRDNFALILETPDLLLNILTSNFNPTHELYKDLEENNLFLKFKEFIFTIVNKEEEKEVELGESPEELMAQAGYNLYECLTEDDIQKFKKYYAEDEELCTFWTNRLRTNYVFFAVKKNVDEIKRKYFLNPLRQDEYGTSVISIQFTKDSTNTLSIKNRYNHTVDNPDATFSNNLDNIIPGLTKSFEEYYDLKQQFATKDFEIPGYTKANDGKYYKYNNEIGNVYYCPDNIIIDNSRVKKYEKEKYLVLDYFILDLEQKEIYLYDAIIKDSFLESIGKIERIEIRNEGEEKKILIFPKEGEVIEIVLDKLNNIIGYKNNNVEEISDYFFKHNKMLQSLEMNNVITIGHNFMDNNLYIKEINFPKVKYIKELFLAYNNSLESVNMPNLKEVENYFFWLNSTLKKLYLPNLKQVGKSFLRNNQDLEELTLPNLEKAGSHFLEYNHILKYLDLPKLKIVGNYFLTYNKGLETVYLPNLEIGGEHFLSIYTHCALRVFIAPKLKKLNDYDTLDSFYDHHPNLEEFVTADNNLCLQRKLD